MRRALSRVGITLALCLGSVVAAGGGAEAKQYGAWQPATAVTPVNDPANDGCPIESPDGLSLYIMSQRGSGGDQDIWVATRDSLDQPFSAPTELPAPVNSSANDFCPTPLPGHRLLLVSNRGGTDAYGTTACGGGDMYMTRYSKATGSWLEPWNLGCVGDGGPNGPGVEYGPSLVETAAGTQLYYSTGPAIGGGGQEIVVSQLGSDGSFGPPVAVEQLNSAVDDVMPNVRKDGLEVVFASTRGGGGFDIWTSTRTSVFQPWSPPVPVEAVNTAAPETRPSLSRDGSRLYFGRAGEIYASTR
ncbi:MAG TPA: hypothetical protein VNU26_12565 [Mycobacteriales bacterium]|nr:hypothetical protein [Mycobacteriales bacterium]